jgi:hypothetical protein
MVPDSEALAGQMRVIRRLVRIGIIHTNDSNHLHTN